MPFDSTSFECLLLNFVSTGKPLQKFDLLNPTFTFVVFVRFQQVSALAGLEFSIADTLISLF